MNKLNSFNGNPNLAKKKILKARTLADLKKQLKSNSKMAYVQASDIKYFENESKPYQVLVMKKWLMKEMKNGSSKSQKIAR